MYADSVIAQDSLLPSPKEFLQVLWTFILVTFSRIFFRSPSITDAFRYMKRIWTDFSYEPYIHPMGYRMLDFYLLLAFFVVYEFLIRKDERSPFRFKSGVVRFAAYTILILGMLLFYDDGVNRSFIYFQF